MSMRSKPPFRADHVGSLLRPAALKTAREQSAKGEIDAAVLKAIEDGEIERVIKKQEEAGLQSITDGEFRRSWWHLDFLWGLDGVEKHVMDSGVAFAAVTTRNEGVKVAGKIGFSSHPVLEHFKFVAAHTKRTPKITIQAPSAIYGRPAPPRPPSPRPGPLRGGGVAPESIGAFIPPSTDCSTLSAKPIKKLCEP